MGNSQRNIAVQPTFQDDYQEIKPLYLLKLELMKELNFIKNDDHDLAITKMMTDPVSEQWGANRLHPHIIFNKHKNIDIFLPKQPAQTTRKEQP